MEASTRLKGIRLQAVTEVTITDEKGTRRLTPNAGGEAPCPQVQHSGVQYPYGFGSRE